MPYKSTLPWRKFPRDTLHNPSLRFVINRMKEEDRLAVFTVFLALYCEADDDGFVDISDEEFFADQCLISAGILESILQHFEKRHLIERVAQDVPIYRIVDWLSPYPQSGGGKTAAERQKEYRERKKEETHGSAGEPIAHPSCESSSPSENEQPVPAVIPLASSQDTPQSEAAAAPDEASADEMRQGTIDAEMNEDICTFIQKGEDLTDEELIAQIVLYKNARKNGASRKEAQEAAEHFRIEAKQVEKVACETVETANDGGNTDDAKKNVMPPVTDGITDRNALHNAHNALRNEHNALCNAAVTLRHKIREEEREREQERERHREENRDRDAEKEGESEKEREEEGDKQKENENQESGNAPQEPDAAADQNVIQHLERVGDEEQEIQGGEVKPVSWITALWESISRDENDFSGLDEVQITQAEALLSSHFKKTGGPLYSESEQEKTAVRFLSMFLYQLADEQNSLEVVISQFVGILNSFIKKRVFFGYEKCTARTLCSSYIFEPVFLKVERILQAKTGGGIRWGQCLISCLKHLKAAEYAVMRLDSG